MNNDAEEEFEIDEEAAENRRRQGEDDVAEDSSSAGKISKMKMELEEIKRERQEYLDGWQRSKADYANLVRRSGEEREEAKARGISRAAEALLPALDSLERAKGAGELPEMFVGITKQLEAGFAALGLTQFGAPGDTFDPVLHEALGTDTTARKEEDNTISAVLEPGYKIGEKILRPAKVRVAHLA